MLSYPDKWDRQTILAHQPPGSIRPLQTNPSPAGTLFWGDNFPVLQHLRATHSGQIDLIYIDPPFATGREFVDRDQTHAYSDAWEDYRYLEFLRRRIILMRELLSDRGSLYLHIDKKVGHYVKLILDEVFGADQFINDITRIKCNPKNFARKAYGNFSDMLLFYAKNRDQQIWNPQREALDEEAMSRLFPRTDPERGAYTTHPLHAPGETLDGDTGQPWRGMMPPQGRHWRYARAVLDKLDAAGLIEWSTTGNPRKKVFAADHPGKKIQDVWTFKDKGQRYVSYPTAKNPAMLARIIAQSSDADSIVLDAFAGSGTTLLTAQGLNRQWIGIDASPQSQKVISAAMMEQDIPHAVYSWESAS
ncbi:MAG: site-specific DNA-methyltransferase [Bacteroidota bacterium]